MVMRLMMRTAAVVEPLPLTVRVRYEKPGTVVGVQPIEMGHVLQPHRVTSTIVILARGISALRRYTL